MFLPLPLTRVQLDCIQNLRWLLDEFTPEERKKMMEGGSGHLLGVRPLFLEEFGSQIGSIGPFDRPGGGVHGHLGEELRISEWLEDLSV